MGQAHRQTSQREQMQSDDHGEGIDMECWTRSGLRSVICWWGYRCLFVDNPRHQELLLDEGASLVQEQFIPSLGVRKCPQVIQHE